MPEATAQPAEPHPLPLPMGLCKVFELSPFWPMCVPRPLKLDDDVNVRSDDKTM